jgi:hypothetical protein
MVVAASKKKASIKKMGAFLLQQPYPVPTTDFAIEYKLAYFYNCRFFVDKKLCLYYNIQQTI